ncbi:MAG: helix-turn-helix transcriptional regulator [Eubacteriales bacterium]|nr:helix-turn-helix transcriptional regulator [Eubacteriales bacterium]
MERFRIHIRALREEHGMTQAELARRLGCAASTISMYEQGRREPSFEVLCALSEIFSVPVESFLASAPSDPEEEELWALREELRRRPEMRMLFSISRKASREDVMKTVKIIEALRGSED